MEKDRINIPFALLLTLAVHFLFIFGVDRIPVRTTLREEQKAIELVVLPPAPNRFVEANPNANEEPPEETKNFAAQDQAAAQELPPDENIPINNLPRIDGEIEDSQKVAEFDRVPEVEAIESVNEPLIPPEEPDVPITPEEGLSEKIDLDSKKEAVSVVPKPKPRPKINRRNTVPAPLMKTNSAISKMGMIAIDANFSKFGEYQQRMMEAISYQWEMLARNFSFTVRDINTQVLIRFLLDSEGNINDVVIEGTNARPLAVALCKDALKSPAPYGLWTEDMVLTLGNEQEIRINFHYR